jgi:hypothetical protein
LRNSPNPDFTSGEFFKINPSEINLQLLGNRDVEIPLDRE